MSSTSSNNGITTHVQDAMMEDEEELTYAIIKPGLIYAIINNVNGMEYVGQTRDFKTRMNAHFNGYGVSTIGNAINEYGKDCFRIEVIARDIVPQNALDRAEIDEIARRKSLHPGGYNLNSGGGGGRRRNKHIVPVEPTAPSCSEEEILGYLGGLEAFWISKKNGSITEGFEKFFVDILGGNCGSLDAGQLLRKCEELFSVEKKMLNYELWLLANTEGAGALGERCRAVRTSVEYARKAITYTSLSFGTLCGDSDFIIEVKTFNTNIIAPPRLSDGILREAIAECNRFVDNSKNNPWNIKARAVYDLETFIREKLAVKKESFSFLNQEMVSNETNRRLTNHKIYWKEIGEDKLITISWTKLLKACGPGFTGYLGVIARDRRLLKDLLNNLYDKNLYLLL